MSEDKTIFYALARGTDDERHVPWKPDRRLHEAVDSIFPRLVAMHQAACQKTLNQPLETQQGLLVEALFTMWCYAAHDIDKLARRCEQLEESKLQLSTAIEEVATGCEGLQQTIEEMTTTLPELLTHAAREEATKSSEPLRTEDDRIVFRSWDITDINGNNAQVTESPEGVHLTVPASEWLGTPDRARELAARIADAADAHDLTTIADGEGRPLTLSVDNLVNLIARDALLLARTAIDHLTPEACEKTDVDVADTISSTLLRMRILAANLSKIATLPWDPKSATDDDGIPF